MSLNSLRLFAILIWIVAALSREECPLYTGYARDYHAPFSTGAYRLSSQRPDPPCRAFQSAAVDATIARVTSEIYDPDLARLFENTFPNMLDTAISWRGVAANNSKEELCFVITGDIQAMWIRDSANQIAPYKSVLRTKKDDVASIFRGVINLQARYLTLYPFCNAFHPPEESGIAFRASMTGYVVLPFYDPNVAMTCNFELDDFGAFLQLSHDYFEKTEDVEFFGKFQWIYAVQSIMAATKAMTQPTYNASTGEWIPSVYQFNSMTQIASGTLGKNGFNNPVNYTGMARAPFRPSDDAAIYDFNIPANMMLSRYLESTSFLMDRLKNAPAGLAQEMLDMAHAIREGIEQWGVVRSPMGEKIYAYEVDGFGGQNLMDDANVPSLLSAPFLGYLDMNDRTYLRTRNFVLSRQNPWWCQGNIISAVGSPHIAPGRSWPMAAIMRAMTTDDYWEIYLSIKEVLASTDGFGLIHESVDSNDASLWSRPWFSWANGLFGQLILDLADRMPDMLKESFQPIPHNLSLLKAR